MSYYRDEAPPRERSSQHYYRDERREERDPRYLETRETFLRVHPSRDLVPRSREDSDLSIEEIRRDFPPPGYRQGDVQRARSADPRGGGYYDDRDDYDRRGYYKERDRDLERRDRKKEYYEEEEKKKRRMLSKQEKIIAAIVGGALIAGGKELYDRREAKKEGGEVHRNAIGSAALAAGGALAAYQGAEFYNKHAEKEDRKALAYRGRDDYSDDEEGSKEKKGHKNFLESALAAAGLGGAVKALTGGEDKDKGKDRDRDRDGRSDTRSRRGSRSRSRSGSPPKADAASRVQKAAMASLIAGATEAFRVAKKPGGWQGEKAKRVFTAAVGAATIDAATNQNADKSSKLGLAESVIGGLLGNRVLNGSKKNIEEDTKTGRSRSRSRAASRGGGGGGGLAALATAGLGALGAKKIMDGRDKSRSPSRSRRRSVDSWDSRDGSPPRKRSRSRSVVDSARRSLAKLGIGKGPDEEGSPRGSTRRRHNDFIDDDYPQPRGGSRRDRDYYDDDDRSFRGGGGRSRSRSRARGGRRGSFSGSESDLGDSSEDEKQARRKKGKQILTTGLAAVATIHAANNVYSSMQKRNARHRAVREGRLSVPEAKKLKSKAILQDAASVGIAALGIKGAISELKEAREISHEVKQFREEKQRRHEKRMRRLNEIRSSSTGPPPRRSRADDWAITAPPRADRYVDDGGPRYVDGNPYASSTLPAPPVGYSRR